MERDGRDLRDDWAVTWAFLNKAISLLTKIQTDFRRSGRQTDLSLVQILGQHYILL